jgi:hypothetical protein
MKDADLPRRLAAASRELRAQLPPATLLPAVHRSLARGRWKPHDARPRWWAWAGWAGLGTAAVALSAVFVVHSTLDTETPDTVASDDGFVRLVTSDEWQRARTGAERTWIVTTELPHSRLAALGLPYDPTRAGERVPAQFLMHSSGEVLAVRVNR